MLSEAMILAGGRGTRLQNILNNHRPKPMAEVDGRPFVEWLVIALRAKDVRRLIFCTGYMSEVIESHFRDGREWGVEILYSRDPTPLGTAGAVRHAVDLIRSDRFLVMNGDSYCRADICHLEEAHIARSARVSLWLVCVDDCSRYGSVTVGGEGVIQAFHEKVQKKRCGLINAGVYLVEREVVELIPEGRPFSMETELFPRLIGHGLYAVVGEGPFLDIGTPETYAAAEQFFLRTY